MPVVLWVFFARPVSLKTVRGAEEAALASIPGEIAGISCSSNAYLSCSS